MAPGSSAKPPDDPRDGRPGRDAGGPRTPTTDEISVILSSSIARPEPDPMLGGSSSWDLSSAAGSPAKSPSSADGLGIVVAPSDPRAGRAGGAEPGPDEAAGWSWPDVLLKSYASALTLALAWLLWSGKGPPPRPAPAPAPHPSFREPPSVRRRVPEPNALQSAPAAAFAFGEEEGLPPLALGKSLVVDDLEITPLLVLQRSVRTTRSLGEELLVRNHEGCLALTLRLKNLGTDGAIRPLDADDLRDGEAFTIDAPPGPRIAMFAMAPSSDWALDQPDFPTLEPGAVEDVVLISEPITRSRLAPLMTWRLRVRTAEGAEDVAVRFARKDVHGSD